MGWSVLWGRLGRLALFGVVAAGAVAFVIRTRGPEMLSAPLTPPAKTKATNAASADGYFILFRLARQRAEAAEESLLRGILTSAKASPKAQDEAGATLSAVLQAAREEVEVEHVLTSQGFPQSAVVISNGQAMVVVPQNRMNDAAAARIGTDLWHLAGIEPEEVLIRPHV